MAILGIAFQQSLAFQEAPNAVSDGVRQMAQLSTRRRLHPTKADARSGCVINVDTIQKEHVKMKSGLSFTR
jgi:hypothetical protein